MRLPGRFPGPRRTGLALSAAVLVLAVIAVPPAAASVLGELLQEALGSSPVMRSAVANLESASARLAQTRAESGVSVNLSSQLQHQHVRDGSASTDRSSGSVRVEASRNVFDDGRAEARVSEAEARVAAATYRMQLAEQRFLLDVVDAYVGILEGQRLLELAEGNRHTLTSELEAARGRFQLGTGTRTAVAQAESRLAESETVVAQRVGELEVVRSRFEFALGRPTPLDIPELIAIPSLPRSLPDAQELANRDHPELKAIRADLYAAESVMQATRALDAGDGLHLYGFAASTFDSERGPPASMRRTHPEVGAGVRFSIPLYDGGSKRARSQEAEHQIEALRADIALTESAVRLEVVSAWEALQFSESVIDSGRTRTEAAALALEGTRRAGQVGQASTLDILDGEQELLNAETSLIRAEYSRMNAAYRLRAAIGSMNMEALPL